jgi:hypothetical protein
MPPVSGNLYFYSSCVKTTRLDTVNFMRMTAKHLAKRLGCSRATIFVLKKAYPDQAPKDFADIPAWQTFALAHAIDADMYLRIRNNL